MPVTRVSVRYTGRVQGVGFRVTARSIASSYPVTGWVRNEADGSVQLEAQGEEADVSGFLDAVALRMKSNIRTLHSAPQAMQSNESGFVIRR